MGSLGLKRYSRMTRVRGSIASTASAATPGPSPSLACSEVDPFNRTICPFQPSFIRHHLEMLTTQLNDLSNALLEVASEKEF